MNLPCPSDERIRDWLGADDAVDDGGALAEHILECDRCRSIMVRLGAQPMRAGEEVPEVDRPTTMQVGRFTLGQPLGAGGMGAVYAAIDPLIGRRVAIKQILPRGSSTRQQERLRLEARALGKLSHPNVVTVYEVGEQQGQVFLAMELIDGTSVRRWLETEDPTWRSALEVYLQAGDGLMAAHEAGLVHRDFKPDNVMRGADGRVRVLDFGLASEVARLESLNDVEVSVSSKLTIPGTIIGTPAYMAPEQLEGKTADARSDQFAFCVCVFEALYQRRPFVARSVRSLLDAIERGHERRPSPARGPRWLYSVIIRGLRSDPARRWPSMHALLEEIRRRLRLRTRRLGLVAAGMLATATATGAGAGAVLREDACAIDDAWRDVWDDSRRATLRAALLQTDLAYADDVAQRVEGRLDDYVSAWGIAYQEICRAEGNPRRAAHSVCLEHRKLEIDGLIDALENPDAQTVQNAIQAVPRPESLQSCDTEAGLLGLLSPPPAGAEAPIRRVRSMVTRAKTLERLGQFDQGLLVARRALDEAKPIGYEPLTAQAHYQLGLLHRAMGRYEPALDSLRSAHWLAEGERHERLAASAASEIVSIAGIQGDVAKGMEWSEHARSALKRAGDDVEVRAVFLNGMGTVQWARGDHEAAGESFAESLRLRASIFGEQSYEVARARMNIAINNVKLGELDAALEQQHRAISAAQQALGPSHPFIAHLMLNLGSIEFNRGDYEQSIIHFQQALELEAAWQPPRWTVAVLAGLGGSFTVVGRHEEAMTSLQEAVDLAKLSLADDMLYAEVLHLLGQAQHYLGEHESARGNLERSRQLYLDKLGEQHTTVALVEADLAAVIHALQPADPLAAQEAIAKARRVYDIFDDSSAELATVVRISLRLGNLHHEVGEHDEARFYYERVYARVRAALAEDHPFRLDVEANLGVLAIDEGEWASAIQWLEPVLRRHDASTVSDSLNVAGIRFDLARALWEDPSERARAVMLATRAMAVSGDFPVHRRFRDEVDQWLQTRDDQDR